MNKPKNSHRIEVLLADTGLCLAHGSGTSKSFQLSLEHDYDLAEHPAKAKIEKQFTTLAQLLDEAA